MRISYYKKKKNFPQTYTDFYFSFPYNLKNVKSKEAKCVVDLSLSINNIKGVGESKRIHGIIVYICQYLFLYILILLISIIFM